MANTTPRRAVIKSAEPARQDGPWNRGSPERKISINVPFPEPLMMQLDYLVQNAAIHSKSSFIRNVVEQACARELEKLARVQEAVKRIEQEDKAEKGRR
jgi:Arc/MetJ-type ribon-helix-helix transcriptional regulator